MDSRLQELKRALESAVEDMSTEQLSWHPANKWCTLEIMEHLYLTYTGTIKGFQRVMQAGKPTLTRPSLTHRARRLVVLGFHYLPSGREAPAVTRPKGLPAEKVRAEIGEEIAAMDAIIRECEDRFGRSTRLLDHLILGPLTAIQWREFHLVHGRHHEKQIRRLRQFAPSGFITRA